MKKKRIHIITLLFVILIISIPAMSIVTIVKLVKNKPDEIIEQTPTQAVDLVNDGKYILPQLYLEGEFLNLKSKSENVSISCKMIVDGKELFSSFASIKLQGTSSLSYDKKNYTINFSKDADNKEKNKVDLGFGWGAQSKYCLKANWIDSTHARNIVTARIAANVQEKYSIFSDAPNNGLIDGYPVEIYANEEYLGLYTINIPKDAWMFNMDKNNENHIVMCAEKNANESTCTFEKAIESEEDYVDWSIEVGPNSTEEEIKQTYDKLNRVIKFIKDSSDEEFKEHFDEYLNLDACLNYLSLIMLDNGIDNVSKNMLFVTYDGKIWYPSLYDLDSTWGLYWNGKYVISADNDFYKYQASRLWNRILTCYKEEFKQRYNELRESVLSDEEIIYEFKRFNSYITEDVFKKEHEKWPDIPSIKYDIEQIITHVKERGEYMDTFVNNL